VNTVEITFLTTTQNGSYDRLAKRQQRVLQREKITSEVITSAHVQKQKINGEKVLVYSTFNVIPKLIQMYNLKPDNTIFMSDSALITIPYLIIGQLLNKGYKIYTVSRFNQINFESFGINIQYKPHFIPDPNPSNEILKKDERPYDFITVGINEVDFDRKGHFWNWLTEVWGFKSIRVCKNYCFGKSLTDIPDEELYKLYKNTKWYLAMSHAETPHLPLIEAFAFGTPAIYLYAHEFMFNGVGQGLPISTSFVSVKGLKNFWFYEVDPESFIDVIGEAYRITDEEYMNYAQNARNLFVSEFKMENRIKEFKDMLGL
jgi:hypothetical protein